MNIAFNGIVDKLASKDFLNINLEAKSFTEIIKKNFLKFTVKTGLNALSG
jgi:hypothetical protein